MKRIWANDPKEDEIVLGGAEHNHIANVLRARVGECVIVLSGDKFDRKYEITGITKRQTVLKFISKAVNDKNPSARFTVYLALIKADNLALVTQKLNEIGAAELKLFSSKFCTVTPKQVNIDRLNEIAKQSCKQCGRSIPLSVSYIGGIGELTADVSKLVAGKVLFADEDFHPQPDGGTDRENNQPQSARVPVGLIVGCEGGFDEDERKILSSAAVPISFGKRILRAETAAIVGAGKWCI
jgi:16S rRNA (uracil1498-N3)-methyltransferase